MDGKFKTESPTFTKPLISEGFIQHSFDRYQEMGGIIKEEDYKNAFARAKNITRTKENISKIEQAELMARVSKIVLTETQLDPRVALYVALRESSNIQLTDQRLFAEVLLMLGDTEALEKLKDRHPHIFSSRIRK